MENLGRLFSLLGVVFLILGILFNLIPRLPRVPGDIDIDKFGFKIYIPFTSAIIASVILTLILNFFRK